MDEGRNGTIRRKRVIDSANYPYTHAGDGHTVIKRREDYDDGSKSFFWPKGNSPRDMLLYNHDLLLKHREQHPDDPVLLVEGEKTADAAVRCGFTAVSLAGSGTQRDFGAALDDLKGLKVALCPDRLDGEKLMLDIATTLGEDVPWQRWVDMPLEVKKHGEVDKGTDFADLLEHVKGDEQAARKWMLDLIEQAPSPERSSTAVEKPRFGPGEDFNDLADEPDEEMVSFGLFSEGTWIIAGAPKLGKSWFALSYTHGLSLGGAVLGSIQVEQTDVLAFILEDGRRRYKARIKRRVENLPRPPRGRFLVWFKWPRLDDEGLERMEAMIATRTTAGRRVAVVIDTGTKLRPLDETNRSVYMGDYNFLDPVTEMAQKYHCLILVIAHTRKAPSEDFIDNVIGSHGISGAVDGIAVLSRERHSKRATLEWTGRDGEEDKRYLKWDATSDGWLLTDELDTATENRRVANGIIDQAILCIKNNPTGGSSMSLNELQVAMKKRRADLMETLSLAVEWNRLEVSGTGQRNDPIRYSVPGT